MSIKLPNGKISRTLPEQVGFNSEKIYEIIKFLNESGLKDLVIRVDATSGTLTPEQYAIAELSPSYIVYEGTVFFKCVEDLSNIDYFELIPQIETDSSMLLNMSRIRVVRDTRAYSQSYVNLFETYNKSQIDSIVSTLNSALATKANLSGANFTGPITSPSIIENMSGYSFSKGSDPDITIEFNYAGVVKNGNKLTFVVACSITRNASVASNNFSVGTFSIPQDIANKLFPQIGTTTLSSFLTWCQNSVTTGETVICRCTKGGTNITFTAFDINVKLVLSSKYYCRFEQTFLLSENLAE